MIENEINTLKTMENRLQCTHALRVECELLKKSVRRCGYFIQSALTASVIRKFIVMLVCDNVETAEIAHSQPVTLFGTCGYQ